MTPVDLLEIDRRLCVERGVVRVDMWGMVLCGAIYFCTFTQPNSKIYDSASC